MSLRVGTVADLGVGRCWPFVIVVESFKKYVLLSVSCTKEINKVSLFMVFLCVFIINNTNSPFYLLSFGIVIVSP